MVEEKVVADHGNKEVLKGSEYIGNMSDVRSGPLAPVVVGYHQNWYNHHFVDCNHCNGLKYMKFSTKATWNGSFWFTFSNFLESGGAFLPA